MSMISINAETIINILKAHGPWKNLLALPAKVAELEERIKKLEGGRPGGEFVEFRGALFKQNPDGSFQEAVYCPKCKTSMSFIPGFNWYACRPCQIQFTALPEELPGILAELAAKNHG
jgi:hypothetical protein